MSVDTYLKGKNLSPYLKLQHEGVKILVSGKLTGWASALQIGVSRFLFWKSLDIEVVPQHAHAPGVA